MVRPFVGGNKSDAHDARAVWTAVQQPGIKTVAIKSEGQQAVLALHRMLGISKRGDTYLGTLLIHGARSVLTNSKAPSEWVLRLAERRPKNVATAALANKIARTIWALLAPDRVYQSNFVSQPA